MGRVEVERKEVPTGIAWMMEHHAGVPRHRLVERCYPRAGTQIGGEEFWAEVWLHGIGGGGGMRCRSPSGSRRRLHYGGQHGLSSILARAHGQAG